MVLNLLPVQDLKVKELSNKFKIKNIYFQRKQAGVHIVIKFSQVS